MNCLFWEHKCKSEVFQKESIVQNRPEFNSCCGDFTYFASKDDAVVEYALSRTMSPTLVSDYTLHVPDKKVLQDKLRKLTEVVLDTGPMWWITA